MLHQMSVWDGVVALALVLPNSSEIGFQLQPPGIHPPPPLTPSQESISSRFAIVLSILSCFRVATQNRLKIDSKTTEKRLEIGSLRGGQWW